MAQIGVFRLGEATAAAGHQLQSWIDRGLVNPRNLDEFRAATNAGAKAVEDLADHARVAGAALPQFQAAINEVSSARKQLDSFMVEGMNVNRSFFVQFGQNLRQGMSAWESFKASGLDALGRISDKLMQMAADKLFASAFSGGSGGGGLLGSIGSLLGLGGGGGGGGGLDLSGATTVNFAAANGGTFGPGWGVVGERGRELIKVHQGGGVTVVPNHITNRVLPGFADGGMLDAGGGVKRLPFAGDTPTVSIGDTNIIVQGNADEKTVAMIKRELAVRDAMFSQKVVASVNDAKRRRLL